MTLPTINEMYSFASTLLPSQITGACVRACYEREKASLNNATYHAIRSDVEKRFRLAPTIYGKVVVVVDNVARSDVACRRVH